MKTYRTSDIYDPCITLKVDQTALNKALIEYVGLTGRMTALDFKGVNLEKEIFIDDIDNGTSLDDYVESFFEEILSELAHNDLSIEAQQNQLDIYNTEIGESVWTDLFSEYETWLEITVSGLDGLCEQLTSEIDKLASEWDTDIKDICTKHLYCLWVYGDIYAAAFVNGVVTDGDESNYSLQECRVYDAEREYKEELVRQAHGEDCNVDAYDLDYVYQEASAGQTMAVDFEGKLYDFQC